MEMSEGKEEFLEDEGLEFELGDLLGEIDFQDEDEGEADDELGFDFEDEDGFEERKEKVCRFELDLVKPKKEIRKESKSCQTFNKRDVSTQTRINKSQQTIREGYYISDVGDKIVFASANRYISWSEMEWRKVQAIIIIQRHFRKWLVRQKEKRILERGSPAPNELMEALMKKRVGERLAIKEDEEMRMESPKRMVDVELLYRQINKWRQEQEEYVLKNRWGAENKAAMAIVGEMEAELLLNLEGVRKRLKEKEREMEIERDFAKMGKPKRWMRGVKRIEMDTVGKIKARELHKIYKRLKAPVVPEGEVGAEGSLEYKERVELLKKIYELTRNERGKVELMLIDLIRREMIYLRINCGKKLLASLRKRIANCFLILCQSQKFNPEAIKLEKVSRDWRKVKDEMVQCESCRRMWNRDEFTIMKGASIGERCKLCTSLYKTGVLRQDLNVYRKMLEELRRDEIMNGVEESTAFLINAGDIQYLVERVWQGQSALSGVDDKYFLRLCRWKKEEEWTPWNCVLLTEEEAISHLKLDSVEEVYTETFFQKVFMKQWTSKKYFDELEKLQKKLN